MNFVGKYLRETKSNSCQMNFANLYCQALEYKTEIAEKDEVLYIRQPGRKVSIVSKDKIAYFPPLGAEDMKEALDEIFKTARAERHMPYLFAVTEEIRKNLENIPEYKISFLESEDWNEYMYISESFRDFDSSALAKQRRAIHRFLNLYGNDAAVEPISKTNIERIIKFQREWLENNLERNSDGASLMAENDSVIRGLRNFDRLGLEGIVVYVGRAVRGYAYGSVLPGGAFDIMAQKGDVAYQQIYKYILREHVRTFCDRAKYTNMEEDIGLSGLRRSKSRYRPSFMLKKYFGIFNDRKVKTN